jgi:hypothetical protein
MIGSVIDNAKSEGSSAIDARALPVSLTPVKNFSAMSLMRVKYT